MKTNVHTVDAVTKEYLYTEKLDLKFLGNDLPNKTTKPLPILIEDTKLVLVNDEWKQIPLPKTRYIYDVDTFEYLNKVDEFKLKDSDLFDLPDNSTEIELCNLLNDEVAIFDKNNNKWLAKKDYRNKTVYSTADKSISLVDYIGDIKEGFTLLTPKEFDKWDAQSNTWVEDTDLKEKMRVSAIKEKAREIIEAKYPIFWQLNNPRMDSAFANDYAWIDNIRDISNNAESNGTLIDDIDWGV
ncbi:hypothetical protein [Arcobacter sp.]|uniref:hypothetical protein n=1 Tax=unclassified Arcobacter TaxID=2593671 RepID=UPI003B0070DB